MVISIMVYLPTFYNDFQYEWDDQWQVLTNPFVTDVNSENLIFHFTNYYHGQYSPVNTLVYIAVYKLAGFNPGVFHAASLLIHLANVLLLFTLIIKIISKIKTKWNHQRLLFFSFFTALIFAIHPLQVETVAWISASKVVLYTFFFLTGLFFYSRYIETNKVWHLLPVIFCYILSYGSKEQAIIFPMNLLLLDYAYGRFNGIRVNHKIFFSDVIVEKIPFFLITGLLYWFSLSNGIGYVATDVYTIGQRFMFGASSIMEYIFRVIAPVRLYYFYFYPVAPGQTLPVYYWIYPILLLIFIWTAWVNYKRKNKVLVFGILLFLVNLALALHILPLPRSYITADRFMYLSIAGAGIVISWLILFIMYRYRHLKNIIIAGTYFWVIFLCYHSFTRTKHWRDSETIKSNVVKLIEERKAKELYFVDPFEDQYEK
ncbi:MAG: hypothetical protein K0B37_11865 [Bacteroidales bacterium]|nr:hypothetical protein [Bacteroidales bacterium]